MWEFLVLLCLPLPGSAMPLLLAQNESSQSPGASPGPPATPQLLPTHSEAPTLLLNLGLNFQGKGPPHKGRGRAPSRPALPPSQPAAPTHSRAEGLGGSVGSSASPAGERAPGPMAQVSNSSSLACAPPALWASAHPLWPREHREHSSKPEFQVDIGVTAALGQEQGSVLGGSGTIPHPALQDPHLPGLQVGVASQGGATGLLGFMLPPEPPEWNVMGSPKEGSGDPQPTAERTLRPGPAESSGSPAASPGSEEASVALPGCEACGSPRSAPDAPLFLALHSDWDAALAAWGPAWEAQVYGAGALFALLALLALLGLLALPCRRRPAAADARLLGLLHLLLLAAGGARAGLLFGPADRRRRERLPALAVRLLHDLPLPCLTSALATALLLLSRRPRAQPSARPGPGPGRPCLLALLLLAHFSAAAGAALAAALLPLLLLASRGLFALLAALLSAAVLGFLCLARGQPARGDGLRSPACQGPLASARQWNRAARAALPAAACFGLLSAGLHAYSVLHALGYGLSPALFGPWPWWVLQLSCQLCEAGVGLPLACLGLSLFRSDAAWRRGLALPPARAAVQPLQPGGLRWALSERKKKLAICDPIARSQSAFLPLCAEPAEEPHGARPLPGAATWSELRLAAEAGDPTADFQPPSPIDLRRSIDEALCSEGLLPASGAFSASSLLSAAEGVPRRALSCLQLVLAQPQADREAALHPGGAGPRLSASSPPGKKSAAGPSLGGGSPPPSPAPPGDPRGGLSPASQEPRGSAGQPGLGAALWQTDLGDVCRPSDALSLGSDTIDL